MPNQNTTFLVPGVYVSEQTAGIIPASLASHEAVYMLGYSSKVGAPQETPHFITGAEDFYNVFGASASANSVQMFFDQRSGAGMYFVNVVPKSSKTATVPTATVGTVYTLTIDGYALSYTAVTGDTATTIFNALAAKVNTEAPYVARMSNGKVRYTAGKVVTATANITLGTEVVAGAYPKVDEVVDTANRAFTTEHPQGFLIAPEFFQAATTASEQNALANGLEAVAADPRFFWIALSDCRAAVANPDSAGGAVNLAKAEKSGLASPKGHLVYYFPYLVNLSGAQVPCSAAIAGIAVRRFRNDGFKEPPAGTQYPIYGVSGVSVAVDDMIQSQLNPQGINCVRRLPNKGIVCWGARTVSSDPYYRFVNTRVIMNVLAGTFRGAYDSLVFSAVDGLGALFGRIKGTAASICERLRLAGALYGATPDEAYRVICDERNNPASALEDGNVAVDVYVKPSPTLEILSVRLVRTSLGSVFEEIINSKLQSNQ